MPQPPRDEEREQRIEMEIIADPNRPEEQVLGWYTSLEENLQFPFLTRCIRERAISPLRVGDEQTMQAVEDWHYWVEQGYEL